MLNEQQLNPLRARAMQYAHTGIIITDATASDNPIIDCNQAFEVITGYPRSEVLGRNCRFLQGFEKDPTEMNILREAIKTERHITVILQNYRKDGTIFWNELSISPIYDDQGVLTNYIGIQNDVTVRENIREELLKQNHELGTLNTELQRQNQQQRDIDSRINDLLKQAHTTYSDIERA